MSRHATFAFLILAMRPSVLPASNTVETGSATVHVEGATGARIGQFHIRLIRITSEPAHETGRYKAGFQSESGTIVTPEVEIRSEQGRAHLVNLEAGHYQISIGAEQYRMQFPQWYFSQVILPREDALRVCPNLRVEENEDSRSVWMLTHHFDVVARKNTDVKITMVPTWVVHGSVAFPSGIPLCADKKKDLFAHVRCRYDGPEGNAPFDLDESGAFVINGSGKGKLEVSIGKPIGADNKIPWEYVIPIAVEPHEVYVLPKVVVKLPR